MAIDFAIFAMQTAQVFQATSAGDLSMSSSLRYKVAANAASLLALSACATTSMTSQVNPQYTGQPVGIVMVAAEIADLKYKQAAEGRICEKIAAGTTSRCLESGQVFFPGQEYSDAERLEIMSSHSIDAVLVLYSTHSGSNTTYVPTTSSTTSTSGRVSSDRFSATSTTRYQGGQTYVKPWASFESRLISVSSGDAMWFATSTTAGNAYAGTGDLVNSVSSKTYSRLLEDGVLRAKPTK